jgi:porin
MMTWRACAARMGGSAILAATLLQFGNVQAQDEGWFAWNTATGNWGGARQRLVNAGVTPQGSYSTDLLANPVGGARQGFAYAGNLEASLEFDLETLLGLKGSSFFIGASWASGRDLSAQRIDNLFTVSQVFEGQSIRLAQIYFEQDLLEKRLNLEVGRLSTGNDFATLNVFNNYVSNAVNGNPFSLSLNAPSFSSDPVASWGVRAIVKPTDELQLAAGVYNADPKVGDDDQNGVDFVLNPQDGVLTIAEAGYHYNQQKDNTGLPGNIKVGGYYDSSKFESFSHAGDQRTGNYGLYANARPDGLS